MSKKFWWPIKMICVCRHNYTSHGIRDNGRYTCEECTCTVYDSISNYNSMKEVREERVNRKNNVS